MISFKTILVRGYNTSITIKYAKLKILFQFRLKSTISIIFILVFLFGVDFLNSNHMESHNFHFVLLPDHIFVTTHTIASLVQL